MARQIRLRAMFWPLPGLSGSTRQRVACAMGVIAAAVLWLAAVPAGAQFLPPGPIPPREGPPGQRPGMVPQGPGVPRPGAPMPGQRPGMQSQLLRVEASGTVDEAGPMGMVIVSPTGQKWQLLYDRDCKLTLKGKAMPDVIRPGVVISFTAEIDKKTGQATDKVTSLIICSADQDHLLGVFPPGSFASRGEGAGDSHPLGGMIGGFPGGGFDQGFGPGGEGPPPAAGGAHSRRQADTGPPVEMFDVCGRITSVTKTGKITVAAPNPYFRAPIQFELAENPEISLELSGRDALPFVARGAKISGKGVQIGPNAARMSEISVELVEPVTFAAPKREPRNGTHRTTERTPGQRSGSSSKSSKTQKQLLPQHEEPAGDAQGDEQSEQSPPKKAAGIDLPPLEN